MTEIHKVIDEAEVVGSELGYVWGRLVHTTIRLLAEGRPIAAAEIAAGRRMVFEALGHPGAAP